MCVHVQTFTVIKNTLTHPCTQRGQIIETYYNHGQKSWDTFAFLGCFPIHTSPIPLPSPHKQCGTRVSRIFSEFQLCIGWGKGELQENFGKDAMLKREPRNNRKIWILCPNDFCPGLSEFWFWGKKSVFFIFPMLFRHFGDKLVITCNNNDLWNYFLNIFTRQFPH